MTDEILLICLYSTFLVLVASSLDSWGGRRRSGDSPKPPQDISSMKGLPAFFEILASGPKTYYFIL